VSGEEMYWLQCETQCHLLASWPLLPVPSCPTLFIIDGQPACVCCGGRAAAYLMGPQQVRVNGTLKPHELPAIDERP
jgi:hypothetical protein